MRLFKIKNDKVKFSLVLAIIFIVIAIGGVLLAFILTSISYGIEKSLGWGLYEIEWLKTIIRVSTISSIFAGVSVGAMMLYGIFKGCKALIVSFRKK